MKFSIGLETERVDRPGEFLTGESVAEIAQAVERLGLDAVFVTDHPAPDDRWLAGGGHHALEPTVALAFAAAATTRIHLHTHIMVLAYRSPFLAAKALASLDLLSGGRLICGVAPGYLRPEFSSLGVDFDRRNELTDESIAMIRQLWAGQSVAGAGPRWKAKGVTQLPALATAPPIWIGGNTGRAMRRAAELGDGWSPFPTAPGLASSAKTSDLSNIGQLAERIDRVRDLRASAGRDGDFDVCCGAFHSGGDGAGALVDELNQMTEIGVTWNTTMIGGSSRAEMLEQLEQFATEVASQVGS